MTDSTMITARFDPMHEQMLKYIMQELNVTRTDALLNGTAMLYHSLPSVQRNSMSEPARITTEELDRR